MDVRKLLRNLLEGTHVQNCKNILDDTRRGTRNSTHIFQSQTYTYIIQNFLPYDGGPGGKEQNFFQTESMSHLPSS
jgi:hypothetical protein